MTLPATAGLGLRDPYVDHFLRGECRVAWLEVHSENFFCGGSRLQMLQRMRDNYPISLHGVGLGLGSAAPLDNHHLHRLRRLCEQIQPAQVSEHLCWNRDASAYINDLLPLPMSQEALTLMVDRVQILQETLGRQVAIENVSRYVQLANADMSEADFFCQLCKQSGCAMLLDVNNLEVNRLNHGDDPYAYIDALSKNIICEIHIAGYSQEPDGSFIDTHGSCVSEQVWNLLDYALRRFRPQPLLLERHTNLPELDILLLEVAKAQALINQHAQTDSC